MDDTSARYRNAKRRIATSQPLNLFEILAKDIFCHALQYWPAKNAKEYGELFRWTTAIAKQFEKHLDLVQTQEDVHD